MPIGVLVSLVTKLSSMTQPCFNGKLTKILNLDFPIANNIILSSQITFGEIVGWVLLAQILSPFTIHLFCSCLIRYSARMSSGTRPSDPWKWKWSNDVGKSESANHKRNRLLGEAAQYQQMLVHCNYIWPPISHKMSKDNKGTFVET